MVLVLCAPFTVTVSFVPSIWIVCVIWPDAFWTLTVIPFPFSLFSSTEQMRVSAMGAVRCYRPRPHRPNFRPVFDGSGQRRVHVDLFQRRGAAARDLLDG